MTTSKMQLCAHCGVRQRAHRGITLSCPTNNGHTFTRQRATGRCWVCDATLDPGEPAAAWCPECFNHYHFETETRRLTALRSLVAEWYRRDNDWCRRVEFRGQSQNVRAYVTLPDLELAAVELGEPDDVHELAIDIGRDPSRMMWLECYPGDPEKPAGPTLEVAEPGTALFSSTWVGAPPR